ncbi:MAG: hypothetical protein ABI397_00190 [Candidatus Saccharimonas sp.]
MVYFISQVPLKLNTVVLPMLRQMVLSARIKYLTLGKSLIHFQSSRDHTKREVEPSQGPNARVSRAVKLSHCSAAGDPNSYFYGVSLILRSLLWLLISLGWYDSLMLKKTLALSTLASFVVLLAFMQVTSPSTTHPIGLLFVFILLYMLALGVLTYILYVGSSLAVSLRFTRARLSLKRAYIYASVVALAPVILVCIQTIGTISLYEVILVIAFEVIACFYVARHR